MSNGKEQFDALTFVSPAQYCDTEKNQDRAEWFRRCAVATVCDGVTTSPHSAEAANDAAHLSPTLFRGNPMAAMRTIADLLVALRLEAQAQEIAVAPSMSELMKEMIRGAARENLAQAFQTTIVTASFTISENRIIVDRIQCGDSEFFAFSADGEALAPTNNSDPRDAGVESNGTPRNAPNGIRFGPHDEILVKIVGPLSERLELASKADIQPRHTQNWLVCRVVDDGVSASRSSNGRAHWLQPGELLLVQRFHLDLTAHSLPKPHHYLRFASSIRRVGQGTQQTTSCFKAASVTAALPDSFYSGRWSRRQERFPANAQFVLASDGFYSAFDDASQLWEWLTTNKRRLCDPLERERLMSELHKRLHARSGDDDMSFVWVWPKARDVAGDAES